MQTGPTEFRSRLLLLVLAAALLAVGCAGTITRPDIDPALDTRPVYLLDHGRHTSLVLTRADHSLIRYLYGDWRWYAKRETGFLRAFPTLFSRTQAALGRQELHGPPGPNVIRHQVPVAIREIHEFQAEANRIDALEAQLDARFQSAIDTLHYNETYDLEFVHDPNPYTFRENSNHVVANWLRELDFTVTGNPIIGRWNVD